LHFRQSKLRGPRLASRSCRGRDARDIRLSRFKRIVRLVFVRHSGLERDTQIESSSIRMQEARVRRGLPFRMPFYAGELQAKSLRVKSTLSGAFDSNRLVRDVFVHIR
jgi:hypothetical protein